MKLTTSWKFAIGFVTSACLAGAAIYIPTWTDDNSREVASVEDPEFIEVEDDFSLESIQKRIVKRIKDSLSLTPTTTRGPKIVTPEPVKHDPAYQKVTTAPQEYDSTANETAQTTTSSSKKDNSIADKYKRDVAQAENEGAPEVADKSTSNLDSDTKEDVVNNFTESNHDTAADEQTTEDNSNSPTSGSSEDTPTEADTTPPIISFDKATGIYGVEIDLALSMNEGGTLNYCVQTGGSCCDPTANPTPYTAPIHLGTTDDNYCVSFYGVDNSGNASATISLGYTIDKTLPTATLNVAKAQIQTNELPLVSSITSADFGKSGHSVRLLNLKNLDPSAAIPLDNNYCNAIKLNFPEATYALDLTGNSNPDVLDMEIIAADINFTLPLWSLIYGTNHLVTLVENDTPVSGSLFSCPTTKLTLKDFEILDFSTGGDSPVNGNGVREFSGEFVQFGHFDTDTSTTEAFGEGAATVGSTTLESGFTTIIN